MQKTITPSICKPKKNEDGTETAAAYAGQVVMKMPTYDERMAIYEDSGVEDSANLKSLRLVRLLAKKLPDYLVSVDIKRLEDGYEFKDWASLQYDSDMGSVISDCCLALIGKIKAGN